MISPNSNHCFISLSVSFGEVLLIVLDSFLKQNDNTSKISKLYYVKL